MRLVKFKCAVVCEMTPKLELNKTLVKLDRGDGTWSGSGAVNVDDRLQVHCKVVGIENEKWSVEITADCPDGGNAAKIFSHPNGVIPSGGAFEFFAAGLVPAILCPGGAEPASFEVLKSAKAARKTAKKAN